VISYYAPALLFLTLASGSIWLLETLYLKPRRNRAGAHAAQSATTAQTGSHEGVALASLGQPMWIECTAGFFPVLACIFVLRSFLFEPFTIPTGSMTPTLLVGDFILVNKFSYGIRLPILNKKIWSIGDPQPGDVMVFRHPKNPEIDLIKRVIGVPGDRIDYHNKRLSINGHALTYQPQPDYLNDADLNLSKQYVEDINGVKHDVLEITERPPLLGNPDNFPGREFCNYDPDGFFCTVPQGKYFMMGDNRDNSSDSRYWGFVPDANIVGKAVSVWMNFHHFGRIGKIR
jgi:signal peptidase I